MQPYQLVYLEYVRINARQGQQTTQLIYLVQVLAVNVTILSVKHAMERLIIVLHAMLHFYKITHVLPPVLLDFLISRQFAHRVHLIAKLVQVHLYVLIAHQIMC